MQPVRILARRGDAAAGQDGLAAIADTQTMGSEGSRCLDDNIRDVHLAAIAIADQCTRLVAGGGHRAAPHPEVAASAGIGADRLVSQCVDRAAAGQIHHAAGLDADGARRRQGVARRAGHDGDTRARQPVACTADLDCDTCAGMDDPVAGLQGEDFAAGRSQFDPAVFGAACGGREDAREKRRQDGGRNGGDARFHDGSDQGRFGTDAPGNSVGTSEAKRRAGRGKTVRRCSER